jgi:CPA2 family monovalent cation:H+ antiporter-2
MGKPIVIIDQNLNLVQEISAGGVTAIYGDASSYENVLAAAKPDKARVIVVALPDSGATRAIVHRARRANPDVLIVARAQRAENDVKLREAGATTGVMPEMAGALMLLEETLLLLGLPHEHIFTGFSALKSEAQSEPGIEPQPG